MSDGWKLAIGIFVAILVLRIIGGDMGGPCADMTGEQARACHDVWRDADRNGGRFLP